MIKLLTGFEDLVTCLVLWYRFVVLSESRYTHAFWHKLNPYVHSKCIWFTTEVYLSCFPQSTVADILKFYGATGN